jgi:hypothetical protein
VLTDLVLEGSAAVRGPSRVSRAGEALQDVLPAVAVYAAIRLIGIAALLVLAGRLDLDGLSRLNTFDGPHLLMLAANGYDPLVPPSRDGRPVASSIAFFPLYPGLVRLLAATPGVGLAAAGFTVTAVGGLVAAAGIDRFGRLAAGGRAGGLVLVALWACWPHSIVLAMPYTEALFVALASWSLVAFLTRHWLTAGVLCLLAGATRPVGTALAGALAVGALAVVVRALAQERRLAWRPLTAAALTPLGFLGYWAWLWSWTGRPDAWFWVQATQWRSTFDGGRFTLSAIDAASQDEVPLVLLVNAVLVVGSVILLLALAVDRPSLPVLLYAALGTMSVVGAAGYAQSKARFLLCVFPLLVPVARALARAPRRQVVVLLLGGVVISTWYNAFVLLVWRYSP